MANRPRHAEAVLPSAKTDTAAPPYRAPGLLARLKAAARALAGGAASVPFSGGGSPGGSYNGLWNFLPGAQYDYEREAGDLWKNSIILPCIKWIETNFPEAPLVVQTRGTESRAKWAPVPDHPLEKLIRRPNPFYGGDTLWAGTNLDLIVGGNAYWHKVRSATGEVVQLWWVPASMIEPDWPRDGSVFISRYLYTVQGKQYPIPASEIVHFRDGIDPENMRKGLSRLRAALREVCTDNECATFSAALTRNMGVPGVILSPEPEPSGGPLGNTSDVVLSREQAEELTERWSEKFTGDNRGAPFVFARPIKVTNPGISPKDLAIDVMRRIPEERISAAIGVPAIVVGLGAGLSRSTFANYREAREAAYENGVIPRQRIYAQQMDVQILPDFEPFVPGGIEGQRVGFDLSEVRALQPDMDALYDRLAVACGGPFLTPNEARDAVGYDAIEGGDLLRAEGQTTAEVTDRVNAAKVE